MSSFTPQQIEEFLQEFFDVVGARQYVGARYVPIFGRAGEDTIEWDDLAPYEPLTVVMHEGVSYVSRRYVPKGIQITDTAYWVETYRFNAQVEQYRQEVLNFDGRITQNSDDIDTLENALPLADFQDTTVKGYVDGIEQQIRDGLDDTYVPWPEGYYNPKYGNLGQVLSTLEDGLTKWVDPVIPDADDVAAAVSAWLNAHPEATTTVEDGSITRAKMSTTDPDVFYNRGTLSGANITLTEILKSGWYGIAGSSVATITDKPDGVTEAGGLSLINYNGFAASGSFTCQILINGADGVYIRIVATATGTVAIPWAKIPQISKTLTAYGDISGSNVDLKTYLHTGWYSVAGSATFTDAPDGYSTNSGSTLFVFDNTAAGGGNYVTQFLVMGSPRRIWCRTITRQGADVSGYEWKEITNTYYNRTPITGAGPYALANFREDGWYGLGGGSTTFTDLPSADVNVNGGNTLFVYTHSSASGNYVTQMYLQGNPRRMWWRTINNDGSTISGFNWFEIIPSTYYWRGTISSSGGDGHLADYIKAGWYGIAGGTTFDDSPDDYSVNSGNSVIIFDQTAASSNFVTQLLIQGNPARVWMRTLTSTGGTISGYGWTQIASTITEPINGKTLEWYGDSTTYGTGGGGIDFPQIVANILRPYTSTNLAVSGRSVSTIRSSPTPMVTAFETEIVEKDVLYFQGGTNDFWSSAPMGTIDSVDPSTFYGALNVIMDRLQTKFPDMCIILGTPFRLRHTSFTGFDPSYILPETNSQGLKMTDYCDAIKAIGIKYCIPVVDNYNECGINPANDAHCNEYMNDGVHPNGNGYKKIGVFVSNKIREYYSHL